MRYALVVRLYGSQLGDEAWWETPRILGIPEANIYKIFRRKPSYETIQKLAPKLAVKMMKKIEKFNHENMYMAATVNHIDLGVVDHRSYQARSYLFPAESVRVEIE